MKGVQANGEEVEEENIDDIVSLSPSMFSWTLSESALGGESEREA